MLVGAGCGGGETGSSAIEAAGEPGEGGTLVWALPERPLSLDPLYAETATEQLVSRQLHEPLVAELSGPFGAGRRGGGLAVSALPSSDRTVWRLRLRPGVGFVDGTPLTASAVLVNAERWQGSATAQALLGEFLVDAPRPDLVRFILPRPDPRFDRRLAAPQLGLVSPRALGRAPGEELTPGQVTGTGTGPFELRERSLDRLLLARNTDWWGTDHGLGPALDQLEFAVVESPSERVAMLVDGTAQVAGRLGPARLRRVRADPLLAVVPGAGGLGLGIERSIRGITADPAPALNGVWRTGIDVG